MSDEERDFSEEEEDAAKSEEEEEKVEDSGPSEAELAMQKRRQVSSADMDETAAELLEENRQERAKMETEINEMRSRSERRKRERIEEERKMADRRAEEEAKRKADEEERRRKKEEEEHTRREARAQKLAELDKFKVDSGRPNFIIAKKSSSAVQEHAPSGDAGEGEEKKSKEQVEEEKRAILKQRVKPLSGMDDMSTQQLAEKAKELHDTIYRLECDRYSLEKRFRNQQVDMIDLAEKARKLNVVGKTIGLKRLTDDSDIMQEKFAGCPSKIEMYSRFERQKDKREYGDRRNLYVGPVYGYPADKIAPTRKVDFQEGGMPQYQDMPGGAAEPEAQAEEAAE